MKNLAVVLGLLLVAGVSSASSIRFSEEKSQVKFEAVGKPAFLKITGSSAKPVGTLDRSGLGEIKIRLEDFQTGIDLRDEHMKHKYLETQKYPEAILKLTKVEGLPTQMDQSGAGSFQGELTLHGVTRPVSGSFDVKDANATAKLTIKLSEYGVEIPKYAGITVAEEVKVEAELADLARVE